MIDGAVGGRRTIASKLDAMVGVVAVELSSMLAALVFRCIIISGAESGRGVTVRGLRLCSSVLVSDIVALVYGGVKKREQFQAYFT